MTTTNHAVFIGGRCGVGKTSAAMALHSMLAERQVRHCVVEGDTLDLAYPEPWEFGLTAKNLQAIWANYVQLGYRRLIYTNTVSVLEMEALAEAMGTDPVIQGILLTASDHQVYERLSLRERGVELKRHFARSCVIANTLMTRVPSDTFTVNTDGKTVEHVAEEILRFLEW